MTTKVSGVDPTLIPKSMTQDQLEWWVLFGICVAGKGAKQTEKKVEALLYHIRNYCAETGSPFELIRYTIQRNSLRWFLEHQKIGQYSRVEKAFTEAVKLDVRKLTVSRLEEIPGIGPKTARMIVLYSDPTANCVPLDTHILKYLRTKGFNAPKSTPAKGPTYDLLEKAFQVLAEKQGKTVRQLDTEVWKSYAKI